MFGYDLFITVLFLTEPRFTSRGSRNGPNCCFEAQVNKKKLTAVLPKSMQTWTCSSESEGSKGVGLFSVGVLELKRCSSIPKDMLDDEFGQLCRGYQNKHVVGLNDRIGEVE